MPRLMLTLHKFAAAKLNLYLHVVGRHHDGYHEIDSLVVWLDLGDKLTFSLADDLKLEVSGPFASEVGPKEDNLVIQAAEYLRKSYSIRLGAKICLDKQLPVGAGMGGGSSDAATALRALMELWKCDPGELNMEALVRSLGADVPACMIGAPALVSGVGEKVALLPVLPMMHVVLVWPGVKLATSRVFAAHQVKGSNKPLRISDLERPDNYLKALLERGNDLQITAQVLCSEIGKALQLLASSIGCVLSRMSGSGSTCFGLFETQEAAQSAANYIVKKRPSWWVRATRLRSET